MVLAKKDFEALVEKLKVQGVDLRKLSQQMGRDLKADLFQHLNDPEMAEKIKKGAKQWEFPEQNVALTSAIDFLRAQNVIDPAFQTALHNLNAREMQEIHTTGGLKGRITRAAIALKDAQKRKLPLMRRR
ncbi:MAG: hypothetical protein V1672_00915 [Candidatus Diapherotrites archaeon]